MGKFGRRVALRFDNLINAGDYAWNRLADQDEDERRQLAPVAVEIGVDGQFGFEQHDESEEGLDEGSDNYIRRRLSPANQKFFEEYLRERDLMETTLHESVGRIWKDGHSVSEPAIASQNDDDQMFPRRLGAQHFKFKFARVETGMSGMFETLKGSNTILDATCQSIDTDKGSLKYLFLGLNAVETVHFLSVTIDSRIVDAKKETFTITKLMEMDSKGKELGLADFIFTVSDTSNKIKNEWFKESMLKVCKKMVDAQK